MNKISILVILFTLLTITACNDSNNDNKPTSDYPQPIEIDLIPSGHAAKGIFDPSTEYDPETGKIWLSYSAVDESPSFNATTDWVVSTRLAYSEDNGASWTDYGAVNPFEEVSDLGTFVHEVSTIVYDSRDTSEPWKLFWLKYFILPNNSRNFSYSWIGVKSAVTPEGLTTATEKRLFAGSIYEDAVDIIQLNTELDMELNKCLAFTEPGVVSTSSALYMSLGCLYSAGTQQDVILLKFTGDSSNITDSTEWSYLGTLLESANASTHGSYTRYTGSELVEKDDDYYLLVSPGSDTPVDAHYNGCLVYQIPDLNTPSITYQDELAVGLGRDDFYGSCDYNSHLSELGILYIYPTLNFSEPSESEFFIYASGVGF